MKHDHAATRRMLSYGELKKYQILAESLIVGLIVGLVIVLHRVILSSVFSLFKNFYSLGRENFVYIPAIFAVLIFLGYIVGKSVNDGALFMMNRNRIYQNSSIAHDYVRGFEQKLAKTIDTLDTDDITEEEPAGDSNTDSAGETHTQEMESKKKFIVKTVEGIEAEKAINMIYAFVRKLAAEE